MHNKNYERTNANLITTLYYMFRVQPSKQTLFSSNFMLQLFALRGTNSYACIWCSIPATHLMLLEIVNNGCSMYFSNVKSRSAFDWASCRNWITVELGLFAAIHEKASICLFLKCLLRCDKINYVFPRNYRL